MDLLFFINRYDVKWVIVREGYLFMCFYFLLIGLGKMIYGYYDVMLKDCNKNYFYGFKICL